MALIKTNARSATALDATILTGNLPAISGASLTTLNASNISSGTLNTARYVQGGITHADQWRLPSDATGDKTPITTWERTDSDGFGGIGTAMGVSSGVFSFAVTGIWFLSFVGYVTPTGTGNNKIAIQTTTDNGTYDTAAMFVSLKGGSCNFMFDVTSTSTHKCKFYTEFDNQSTILEGNTNNTLSGLTFLRLGDT